MYDFAAMSPHSPSADPVILERFLQESRQGAFSAGAITSGAHLH
jgi:hypothetical protein